MKWRLLIALLCLCAAPVSAQTITRKAQWTYAAPLTLADAQAYVYTFQVDAATPVVIVATCVAGTPVACSAPVTFASGPHTLVLTASNGFGTANAVLSGSPPGNPATFQISVRMSVVSLVFRGLMVGPWHTSSSKRITR